MTHRERDSRVVLHWSTSARQYFATLSADEQHSFLGSLTNSKAVQDLKAGERITLTVHLGDLFNKELYVVRSGEGQFAWLITPDETFQILSPLSQFDGAEPSLRDSVAPDRREPPRAARLNLNLGVRLAGRRRSHLRDEWLAVLVELTPRQQVVLALGFLLTGLRLRLRDAARPAWRPVDWTLRVQSRTNAVIVALVGAQALYIVRGDGLDALITEVWEPCGIAGAALYALAHWLRRVRGIELAAPARSTDEER
ncbi:hypothetical protein ACIQU5_32095 [Streptomyces sp. NPDC090306]|uniref:hypothetical protein n=1 Tax=Streptomyces sp. NPDC090306 TaxID=3365961 RepID=UPI003810D50D